MVEQKYSCKVCGREFYREDTALKCRHDKPYEVKIVKDGNEHELRDIRLLTDKADIERASRIMAARKKLEQEFNFDEDEL